MNESQFWNSYNQAVSQFCLKNSTSKHYDEIISVMIGDGELLLYYIILYLQFDLVFKTRT